MIVGNIGVRQRAVSSGAFLHEAIRPLILIVALQTRPPGGRLRPQMGHKDPAGRYQQGRSQGLTPEAGL